MNLNCNQGSANGLSAHTRELLGFAAIIRLNSQGFHLHPPTIAASGRVVTIGDWAIAMDQSTPAATYFGQHGNCNPVARCVGCEQICPAEDAAVDLSVKSSGKSALWIETQSPKAKIGDVTVRSFVPGRPGLSGLWIPTVCTKTQELELIAVDGSRLARLRADGHLKTSTLLPRDGRPAMAATMFLRLWASMSAMTTIVCPSSCGPAPSTASAI